MSLGSKDSTTSRKSTASWSTIGAEFALLPQYEVNEDGVSLLGSSSTTLEKPSGKAQCSLVSRVRLDSWVWESVCWLLSVACLATITYILHINNKTLLRQTPGSDITINTIISVFTVIAKIALLVPITESISQLKWVWFATESRKLQDFEIFDKASKGIWGSISLLCTLKAKPWGSLGAIIMIAGAAVEPFTQEIISFPLQWHRLPPRTVNVTATVAYSQNFIVKTAPPGGNVKDVKDETFGSVDMSMMHSMYSSSFYPAHLAISPIAPLCSTGNCSFPTFHSIAVRAIGADITDLLTLCDGTEDPSCTHKLPNLVSMDSMNTLVQISSTSPDWYYYYYNSSIDPFEPFTQTFYGIAHPLTNVFVIYLDHASNAIRAAEFVFEYCVKSYETGVISGRPYTKEYATYTNYTYYTTKHLVNSTTARLANSTLVFRTPDSSMTYNVTSYMQSAMRTFTGRLFSGAMFNSTIQYSTIGSSVLDAIMNPPYNQIGIQGLMDNVAMSITNNIRDRNNNIDGAPLQGQALVLLPFIHVKWEWLSMLAAVVVLTLVLMVVTALQTRRTRTKLWKSSILAVLRAGAEADEGLKRDWAVGGMGRMSVVDQGKGLGVVLVNEKGIGGGGWRLVRG